MRKDGSALLDDSAVEPLSGLLSSEILLSDECSVTTRASRKARPSCRSELTQDYTSSGASIAMLGDQARWLTIAESELKQIANLPQGWDGYDSPPLLAELYHNARKFLHCLEVDDLPVPYVGPISGGGVQLEWHIGGRELEVEFMEPDAIGYLKVFEDGSSVEGEFFPDDFDQARQIIKWVASGNQ